MNEQFQTLKNDENIKITNVTYTSTLVCKKALRKDTTKYTITVTNEHGSDTADIQVVVLGALNLNDEFSIKSNLL